MNKVVMTSLIGVLFAVLAFFHVGLPATLTQEGAVGTAMLILSAVTIVVRFLHGDAIDGVKAWWQSKTIWTAIVAAMFALLALFGIVPGIDQESVLAIVMLVAGAAGSLFGMTSKTAIG